jgi:hypothetical protein
MSARAHHSHQPGALRVRAAHAPRAGRHPVAPPALPSTTQRWRRRTPAHPCNSAAGPCPCCPRMLLSCERQRTRCDRQRRGRERRASLPFIGAGAEAVDQGSGSGSGSAALAPAPQPEWLLGSAGGCPPLAREALSAARQRGCARGLVARVCAIWAGGPPSVPFRPTICCCWGCRAPEACLDSLPDGVWCRAVERHRARQAPLPLSPPPSRPV